MDTPRGNVYTFKKSSFCRFTKFCGKIGLIIWATWSTYVFVYHRPLLQKRTQQLEQARAEHARQMSDLQTYLEKYNELTRELNLTDDKILNGKKLTDAQREDLIKSRLKTWGELDFLHTRLNEMFTDENYVPDYVQLSKLSAEFELTRAENEEMKKRNAQMLESMLAIADADAQIVETVSKITSENIEELRKNMKRINSTIATLGLSEQTMIENANKYASPLVGAAFGPLDIDKDLDEKYQKLAHDLELWNGLAKANTILPLGAPVASVRVTSN